MHIPSTEIDEKKGGNLQLLFDEAKKKYQWPDEIDIQMSQYIETFDGRDLRLLYKVFKQDGKGEYIDTKKIRSLHFPTGWADKPKTAPLFEGNLFFTREPSNNGKRSTLYRLLPAGKTLFAWMDQHPDLVDEQGMSDLTLLFRSGEGNIVNAIGKTGEIRVHCFSHEAVQEIQAIQEVLYFEYELQEKYGRTKEETKEILEKHKDIKDIQGILTTIENEYSQYGEAAPRELPTSDYLYDVLMTAEEIHTS